jgi:hypothetical protein
MLAFKLESMVYLKLRDYSFKARMLAKNYITSKKIKIPNEKIKLIDNTPLTDDEFERVNKICDIFSAIGDAAIDVVSPPEGGLFWSFAKKGMGPFYLIHVFVIFLRLLMKWMKSHLRWIFGQENMFV